MLRYINLLLLLTPLISTAIIQTPSHEGPIPSITPNAEDHENVRRVYVPNKRYPDVLSHSSSTTLPGAYVDKTSSTKSRTSNKPAPTIDPMLAGTILNYGYPFKQFTDLLLERKKISEKELREIMQTLESMPGSGREDCEGVGTVSTKGTMTSLSNVGIVTDSVVIDESYHMWTSRL
jgi:hypothetical protein